MTAFAILHTLIAAGAEFETDGERIRWRNAGGRMTPDVIEVFRAHRAEVIDHLVRIPVLPRWHEIVVRHSPIDAAILAAFEDYQATDDICDQRAWA